MSLSVITAIHNGLAMNKFYWQSLLENTTSEFELIVVDNHSVDGSEYFFSELAKENKGPRVVHVRNEYNQNYPASQNQGMELARYDTLCFLNNDLWLPKGWNEPLELALKENPLYVLSPSSQEAQPSQRASDWLKTKWKYAFTASRLWQRLFGQSEEHCFWNALGLMYGNVEEFKPPTQSGGDRFFHGIAGSAVVFTKALLERVPSIWDERFQAADWHLYLTIHKQHCAEPDLPLPRVVLDSYVHHFGRYSVRRGFEPWKTAMPALSIEDYWSPKEVQDLWWGNHPLITFS